MQLKELRQEKGFTQAEVAKAIKTSQRNIGRWENGENEPSASFVARLAKFFDVSADYLLGLEDDFGVLTAAPMGESLTASERELIAEFRRLSPYLQGLTLETVRNWSGKTDSATDSDLHKKA